MWRIATCKPWLVGADEVDQVDARLKVPIGRHVLVVSRGRHVVREAQAVEAVLEVHVQQALISTVKRDAPFGHGHQGVVVTHVGREDHDSRVEDVRPPHVWGG